MTYTVVTLWSRLLKEFYGYEGKFVIENDRETDKAYRGMGIVRTYEGEMQIKITVLWKTISEYEFSVERIVGIFVSDLPA